MLVRPFLALPGPAVTGRQPMPPAVGIFVFPAYKDSHSEGVSAPTTSYRHRHPLTQAARSRPGLKPRIGFGGCQDSAFPTSHTPEDTGEPTHSTTVEAAATPLGSVARLQGSGSHTSRQIDAQTRVMPAARVDTLRGPRVGSSCRPGQQGLRIETQHVLGLLHSRCSRRRRTRC